jgi:plastocyanin
MVRPPPTNPIPAVVFLKGPFETQRTAASPKNPTLAQKDAWFIPEVLAVLVGTTVDFPNLDTQYHNVFSYSKPKRFDLGRYPTGESRPVTFDKPGMVKVYCEIHEHMRAWVVVCENPYFAMTDADGNYRIENVPGGKHTLVVWRSQGKELEKEVTVVAGQHLAVDFE